MRSSPAYWIQGGLFVAAAFFFGQWAEGEIAARRYQGVAGRVLREWIAAGSGGAWAERQSPHAERTRLQARRTGVVGRLRIPRLGLSTMVGEGIDDRTLSRAVGHVPGTAFPGEAGNVSLAGHRDTFLRKLGGVRRGDRIELITPDGTFSYRVEAATVVSPRAVHVLDDDGRPVLTLVTCYPFHAIGPAPDRFVVRALRIEGEGKELHSKSTIFHRSWVTRRGGNSSATVTEPVIRLQERRLTFDSKLRLALAPKSQWDIDSRRWGVGGEK